MFAIVDEETGEVIARVSNEWLTGLRMWFQAEFKTHPADWGAAPRRWAAIRETPKGTVCTMRETTGL